MKTPKNVVTKRVRVCLLRFQNPFNSTWFNMKSITVTTCQKWPRRWFSLGYAIYSEIMQHSSNFCIPHWIFYLPLRCARKNFAVFFLKKKIIIATFFSNKRGHPWVFMIGSLKSLILIATSQLYLCLAKFYFDSNTTDFTSNIIDQLCLWLLRC